MNGANFCPLFSVPCPRARAAMAAPKRGSLGGVDGPSSRQEYQCEANCCTHVCRGDKLADHFRKSSDLTILETMRSMSISVAETYIRTTIDNKAKQNHTLHLLQGGFDAQKLPSWSDHKQSKPSQKALTPFQQIAKAKKAKMAADHSGDSECCVRLTCCVTE